MARWQRGQSDVEGMVAAGELQRVIGDVANGKRLLDKAARTIRGASAAPQRVGVPRARW